MNASVDSILKKNELSVTDSRKKILQLFLKHAGALNHGVIEKTMGDNMDRVTIYRTLQAFVEKGLIHTIPSSDNAIHYALCKEQCMGGRHQDNHVHFVCTICGATICLDEVTIPEVKLPKGFRPDYAQMVVSGTCSDCI